jgi:hypothetical protein
LGKHFFVVDWLATKQVMVVMIHAGHLGGRMLDRAVLAGTSVRGMRAVHGACMNAMIRKRAVVARESGPVCARRRASSSQS